MSDQEFEAAVASLFADTLRETEVLAELGSIPASEPRREALTLFAADLFEGMAPLAERRIVEEVLPAADCALAVLRDVADACALTSVTRTEGDRVRRCAPTRALIELEIRLYEIDEWMRSLGLNLDLQDSGNEIPEEAWRTEAMPAFSDGDYVETFAAAVEGYDRFRNLLSDADAIPLLRSDKFRAVVCDEIGSARGWLVWARGNVEPDLQLLADAMIYIAGGCFLAAVREVQPDELFPTNEALLELTRGPLIHSFLSAHGATLPPWFAE